MIGGVAGGQRAHAPETEFNARGIENLGETVGVEKQFVPRSELQLANVILCRRKHAEGHAGSRLGADARARDVLQRKVAGADVFDFSVVLRAADDHGGELSGGGALREKTIGVSHQGAKRKMLFSEGAKRGV